MLRNRSMSRANRHRWLLLVPFVWQVALAPLFNDVRAQPLGLPFPMAWQMLGILVTTACIAIVYRIDRRNVSPDDRA